MHDYTFDLHRIFFGDLPALFFVEIAMRTTFLFLIAFGLLRIMGKRSLGQLSPFDWVIIIALGSAIGDPMFYDDVPLLYGVTVVSMIVLLERVLSRLTLRHAKLEAWIDAPPTILVRNGSVDQAALRRESITINELHESLRLHDVERLDQVQLAILEPSGKLSVLKTDADSAAPELWQVGLKRDAGSPG